MALARIVFTTLALAALGAEAQTLVDPRPRTGLTAAQLSQFQTGLTLFKQAFPSTLPGRNEDRCSNCHFRPAVGGHGFVYHANVLHGFTYEHASREVGVPRWPTGFVDGSPPPTLVHFEGVNQPAHVWTNAISRRVVRGLAGIGSLERIPRSQLLARQDPDDLQRDGISGRLLGRFGSQGQWDSLEQIVREVMTNELGVAAANVRSDQVALLAAFLRGLRDPVEAPSNINIRDGELLFVRVGCAGCHVPSYVLPGGRVIRPFSDFLVHDMGPCLDDGITLGSAESYEWRTPPLWGMNERGALLLHDGRGGRPLQQVWFHCGEASASRDAFALLTQTERDHVRLFMASLVESP